MTDVVYEGPYLSKGSPYWRVDVIRDGVRRWSSLRTKDEREAKAKVVALAKASRTTERELLREASDYFYATGNCAELYARIESFLKGNGEGE